MRRIHHSLASRVTAAVNARGYESLAATSGVTVADLRRVVLRAEASQRTLRALASIVGAP